MTSIFPISRFLPCRKRQQGDVAGALDGRGQLALMRRADAGQTPRHNLAALSNKLLQQTHVLVVDVVNCFDAEFANFLATKKFAPAFANSGSTGTAIGTVSALRSIRPAHGTRWWC